MFKIDYYIINKTFVNVLLLLYPEANQDKVGDPGKINRWGPSKILFC